MLARVYTCQKATLLEIICRGSYVFNYCMVTHNWYFFYIECRPDEMPTKLISVCTDCYYHGQ